MLNIFKRDRRQQEREKSNFAQNSIDFALFNAVSGSQRSSFGDRGEMCSGAMNNNQRFATMQMLRNMREQD